MIEEIFGSMPFDHKNRNMASDDDTDDDTPSEKREFTLRDLQQEQKEWVKHNFPNRQDYYPLLGAVEELGELAHAHLKNLQGIRGTPEEHLEAKEDAVADVIIFLSDYCTATGIDLQAALEKTWAKVKQRDWIKNQKTGE